MTDKTVTLDEWLENLTDEHRDRLIDRLIREPPVTDPLLAKLMSVRYPMAPE